MYFNPRTREGCDLSFGLSRISNVISIHAPARGATPSGSSTLKIFLISIHAPARGATKRFYDVYWLQIISIHAPARGATQVWSKCKQDCRNFNPRTREGCDISVLLCHTHTLDFNPRTREGCDGKGKRLIIRILYFNPRTREGCDSFSISSVFF